MRFSLLIGLLLPALVWARPDRFSILPTSCAGELVSPLEIDAADPRDPQLVFQGRLTWYRDGQSRNFPAVRDQELGDHVTPNPDLAHAYLQPGDAIVILDDKQRVAHDGILGRDPATGKLVLFSDDRLRLSHRDLKEWITRGPVATVVRSVGPYEFDRWRDQLAPWLRRYRAHLAANAGPQLIGGRRFERAHFEKSWEGTPAFEYEGETLRLWIQTGDGRVELGEGDRLFLMDADGKLFFERRLAGDLIALREDLLRAKTAVAFTRPF